MFGTSDIRIYAAELWAKYTGAADYEQEHHRDYLNHTPLVPSSDVTYRGLEMFVWLTDVPEELGPTHIVPLGMTAQAPALPHGYQRSDWPDLYQAEVSATGPAGTVVAYSTDTFHPPPGHPYWTEETLAGMAIRYPHLDLTPWRD